jgi:hypothetical protein
MTNELPGYDAWKLATPPEDDITPEQERAMEQERWEQEERLREAVADAMHNERGGLYLSGIRKIVIEELNKMERQPGEPEWQTRTPVPVPRMG